MRSKIIGFSGAIGSGKTTAARELCAMGFTRVRFGQALRDMLAALGLTADELEGEAKEKPCRLICGATPRRAMQTLGTEWGRELISPDLWVNVWSRRAIECERVVVDDVRFDNEVAAIRALGGIVIHIARPVSIAEKIVRFEARGHASEHQHPPFDAEIRNDGSLEAFRDRIRKIGAGTDGRPDQGAAS